MSTSDGMLEITDLLIALDPVTGARRSVSRNEIVDPRWQLVLVGFLVLAPGVLFEPCRDRRISQSMLRVG